MSLDSDIEDALELIKEHPELVREMIREAMEDKESGKWLDDIKKIDLPTLDFDLGKTND